MTEQQLIEAYTESTQLHANEGVERGLDPIAVANILLLASLAITVQIDGVENARQGLLRVAEQLA